MTYKTIPGSTSEKNYPTRANYKSLPFPRGGTEGLMAIAMDFSGTLATLSGTMAITMTFSGTLTS